MNEIEVQKEKLFLAEDILYPLIAGIGILANTFVIVVVLIWEQSRANRTVANVFVINLAIADLLFLFVLPLNMPFLIDEGWIYGSFMCKLMQATKYINFRASICFLTTMTADRYFAIVHSLTSRTYRTRKNGVKVCLLLWLLVVLISIPLLIYSDVIKEQDVLRCKTRFPGYQSNTLSYEDLFKELNITYSEYETRNTSIHTSNDSLANYVDYNYWEEFNSASDYGPTSPSEGSSIDEEPHVCLDREHAESAPHITSVYANFIFFFLIPILLILFCYGTIIKVTITRNISSTTVGGVHNRVAVMVASLVSVFIICWMPFQVFELLILPPGLQINFVNDCTILKSVFAMLAWSNSAINPILYSISSKRFRDKAVVAWTFIKHGKIRAMAVRSSQRTMQTKLQTTATGSSLKGVTTPKLPRNNPQSPLPGSNPVYAWRET